MVTRLINFCLLCLTLNLLAFNANAARYETAAIHYDKKNYAVAFKQFEELASLGNKDAQYAIALMHLNGYGVKTNHLKAYAWFKLASSQGDKAAHKSYTQIYSLMNDNQKNAAEAVFKEVNSELSDDAVSQRLYPTQEGASVSTTPARPLRVVQPIYPQRAVKASIIGEATIKFDVGKDGRTKNFSISNYTHKLLLDSSLAAARKIIFQVKTLDGEPVEQHGVQYRYLYNLAGATTNTGLAYKQLSLLKQKALKGTSVDRYKFALGIEVLTDYIAPDKQKEFGNATDWFSKAARDGLPQAKFILGINNYYGEQCKRDINKGGFWLQSAANDGLPSALVFLARQELSSQKPNEVEAALQKLQQAADANDPQGKLEYARALSFPTNNLKPNFDQAIGLVEGINDKGFLDPISLYEVRFLIYKAAGVDKQAKKSLKKLKKLAKKHKMPWQAFEQNLRRQLEGKQVLPLIST